MEEAFARAEEGELSGILEVDSLTLEIGNARWTGEDEPSSLRKTNLRQAVSQAAVRVRMEEVLGDAEEVEDFQRLLEGGELEVVTLREESLDEFQRMAGHGAGFAGAMLLYVTLLTYGTMVMRATLEEKTGRIAEVVLSSMHPRELMLGKIFGVGAVGFTQLAIWIGAMILVASSALPTLLAILPPEVVIDTDVLEMLRAAVPAVGVALFFLLCFTFGFLTYASLFAAVGAMCSSDEEAQQLQFPLVMLVVVPMALISPVLRDPNSTFAVLTSLFPLFSPVLMFARVASGAAPAWQAALAIVLKGGALFLVATIAGRNYRVGILMQGKRPTLPEIVRWVRES
jgi:ABC-2 type transport system permease protein